MPVRREQVAAALKYLGDKADLRGRFERAISLDPQEQDLADIAVETGASLIPGVGPALAARDFERARRADDPAGMAMAAASAIPGERLAKLLKGFDPTRLELDVYHGTPHRFPATEANPLGEFDASKIGTGEGAQAYGHGTYYAESPDVAKTYRSSNDPIARKAEMLLQSSDGDVSRAMRYAQKKVEDLEKNRDVKGFFSPVALEQNKGALEYLKQIKSGKTPQVGTLYKADLPDEMIDRMLDWDKPLSEQPVSVQKALMKLPNAQKLDETMTGAQLLESKMLVPGEMRDSAEASRRLQQLGIPGIKYRDAGSRGQGGTGTRNFVVFPGEEKKVRILERK
jgi:hypothetical protein